MKRQMQNKKEVRRKSLMLRRSLSQSQVKQKSETICELILSSKEYENASCVMAFASMPDEVQTMRLLRAVLADGKQLCLPYIDDLAKGIMRAVFITSLENLSLGKAGILTAAENGLCFADPEKIDLVIVPGVAFDQNKYRLGMGGGFYDRFLPKAKNAVKIGIYFSVQQIISVPVEKYDFPLEMIITEKGRVGEYQY